MITVREFCRLFTDPRMQEIDIDIVHEDKASETVFSGYADDASNSKYADYMVDSVDTLYDRTEVITLNISTAD